MKSREYILSVNQILWTFSNHPNAVGHGLIINLDTLKRVGGFPTHFSNEDLPLRYMLRVNNEFVDIYPSLENSESPSTIKNVFTQYRTWFYGVAYYPQYCLYALNNYCLPLKYKFYAIFWALRGIIRSIHLQPAEEKPNLFIEPLPTTTKAFFLLKF